MMTRVLVVAVGFFAVGVLASPADDSPNSLSYPDLITTAPYPAHVRAIHFDDSTIDATHSVSWGAWSVSFGAQPPVASYMNNGIAQVQVNGLVCTNSIAGTFPCGMNLSPNGCAQSLGMPNTAPMLITCPESIELTP
jgi:hypothetical protein